MSSNLREMAVPGGRQVDITKLIDNSKFNSFSLIRGGDLFSGDRV